jgi:hypothetical protein
VSAMKKGEFVLNFSEPNSLSLRSSNVRTITFVFASILSILNQPTHFVMEACKGRLIAL